MIDSLGTTHAGGPMPASLMSGPGGALGKDEFIKLLLAQMRHQDPLNPMKGEELAVQLAQFSTVEQLMNLNVMMENQGNFQLAMVDAMNGNSALAAIGRDIVALGNQVLIPASSEVQILVGGTGGEGVLRIYDASGKEVGSRPLGTLVDGRQSVALGDAIDGLPDGEYTYAVEVTDGSGNRVPTQTFVTGRVDGVRYGSNGPVLTSGPFEIPIGSIVEIVVGG